MRNSMRLRHCGPAILSLSTPWAFRALLGTVALVLALAMVAGGQVSPVAAVLLAVTLLGALYVDEWRFDTGAGLVTHRLGLLVAARTRRYPIGDVREVRVYRAPAGAAGSRYYRVAMVMGDGSEIAVEVDKTTAQTPEEHAEEIANHTGVGVVMR